MECALTVIKGTFDPVFGNSCLREERNRSAARIVNFFDSPRCAMVSLSLIATEGCLSIVFYCLLNDRPF